MLLYSCSNFSLSFGQWFTCAYWVIASISYICLLFTEGYGSISSKWHCWEWLHIWSLLTWSSMSWRLHPIQKRDASRFDGRSKAYLAWRYNDQCHIFQLHFLNFLTLKCWDYFFWSIKVSLWSRIDAWILLVTAHGSREFIVQLALFFFSSQWPFSGSSKFWNILTWWRNIRLCEWSITLLIWVLKSRQKCYPYLFCHFHLLFIYHKSDIRHWIIQHILKYKESLNQCCIYDSWFGTG